MATLSIKMLYCVHEATGIDLAAITAIIGVLPSQIAIEDIGDVVRVLQQVPGVLEALDVARADPDILYLTKVTAGQLDNAIWPGGGNVNDIQGGQSVALDVQCEFDFSQNISLWDYDVSDDDLLGSVTAFASEAGQGIQVKLASSNVEGSAYYVIYEVY